jgi:poly(3-hydroxybutyrate) depolymerase
MVRENLARFAAGAVVGTVAAMTDLLLHGEKTPSPVSVMKRYGTTDAEQQAAFVIDQAGVIRYVHTTGSLGGLPSNAEYLRELDSLQ